MHVLDVDPELLRRTAAAAVHTGEQAATHIDAEIRGSVPGIMDTLAPNEPYAWMLRPVFEPDGSVRLPVATTRREIVALYEEIRGSRDAIRQEPVVELRGAWYAFWECISTNRDKGGPASSHPIAVLSPAGASDGITGEIIWPQIPRAVLGTGPAPADAELEHAWQLQTELRLQHCRFLDCFANADVDGILDDMDDGVASAVRDYVDDTGMLVELHGKVAHREHFQAFFDRYEVRSVELVHRIAQDWYLSAETRITVRGRGGSAGDPRAFHVAEIHAPAKDGRIVARLGWGTDVS